MEQLIHITASYSNALLVAILPHISNFGKTLDLPIQQPVTVEQVLRFNPNPYRGHYAGSVVLKNRYWFFFDEGGYVSSFTSPSNVFTAQEEFLENVTNYMGRTRMTTNEIVTFARETLLKLGHTPAKTRADAAPELQGPSDLKRGGHVPYCRVAWRDNGSSDGSSDVHVDINTQDKIVVGLSVLFARTNQVGTPLKIDVEPELESDYRKRIQVKWSVPSNAPPRVPLTKPSERNWP